MGIYKKKGLGLVFCGHNRKKEIRVRVFIQKRCVYNKSVAFYTTLCI